MFLLFHVFHGLLIMGLLITWGRFTIFHTYTPYAGNFNVIIPDGSLSAIARKGSIKPNDSFILKNVLHVSNLYYNLLSFSKITFNANCSATFLPYVFQFQDLSPGKMISSTRECSGLHYFDDGCNVNGQAQFSTSKSLSVKNNDNVMLWHFRFGHPGFQYMNYLFPKLFLNKHCSQFYCEVCELAKHLRSSVPPHLYQPTAPFTLVHSDV